jgi:hypothetical protein
MDGAVVGEVLVVLVLLTSWRLGWSATRSHGVLVAAAVLFAFSLVAPIVAATDHEEGWAVAGALALAFGFLLLVYGVLQLDRNVRESPARSASSRPRRPRPRVPDPFDEPARPEEPPSGTEESPPTG